MNPILHSFRFSSGHHGYLACVRCTCEIEEGIETIELEVNIGLSDHAKYSFTERFRPECYHLDLYLESLLVEIVRRLPLPSIDKRVKSPSYHLQYLLLSSRELHLERSYRCLKC